MTRGKLVIILNKAVIVSCEFNGDMYPTGYGKQVFDQLKMIFTIEEFNDFVKYFNDKNFQYEDTYSKTYSESREWFEKAKDLRKGYFDNWFSDWLFVKNCSSKKVDFITDGDEVVTLEQNEIYAFNFGSVPDDEDKKFLGM